MSKITPRFRITPSLLNKYQDLLDSDLDWQRFYGDSDEPPCTMEEYYAIREQELLNACNRIPFISEAASKGTALNELVDCILDRRPQREDMKVWRVYDEESVSNPTVIALHAELDGFPFDFDLPLVNSLSDYFFGSICQHRCEAELDTAFGPVILYGDADYIRMDVVYDLKTTSNYTYGKYEKGWQKHLYPWALIKSGDVQSITGFEYTVVPLRGGNSRAPLISGEINREWYDFRFDDSEARLRDMVEAFIPWIEGHRESITHPRIFNQE